MIEPTKLSPAYWTEFFVKFKQDKENTIKYLFKKGDDSHGLQ